MMNPTTRFSKSYPIVVLFLFFACSQSVQKSPAVDPSPTCIKKVIAADDVLGKTRNHACEKISLAKTIRDYTDGLEKLDYSDCPSAFAEGFKKHIAAWRALIPFVEKYPDMRGEMHDLFDVFEKGETAGTFAPLLKAVWDTWAEIEESMSIDTK